MKPRFWKVSQGPEFFDEAAMIQSVHDQLVYVHKDTRPKGTSERSQGREFADAAVGDYFYLTYGNRGVYLLGQFCGPANLFSAKLDGWLDRPFRLIRVSRNRDPYVGPKKWWAPNENSTFTRVPDSEFAEFENSILRPYFDLSLAAVGYEL